MRLILFFLFTRRVTLLVVSFLLVVSTIFTFLPSVVFASNFSTDYQVTYTVSDNGMTHVVLDVILTNTSSSYYAESYKMQIGFSDVRNLKITDPKGLVVPEIQKSKEGYIVQMTFNKKAVGLGTKLPFTMSFDTPDVAKKYGKVWEINIPGIANPGDFASFIVLVKTPPSFGNPSFTKPIPLDRSNLAFNKDQLGKSGISITFGSEQLYKFQLSYHLQNSNPFSSAQTITLPPTTNYQDIAIRDISPRPNNVTIDTDGNWIADFSLLPSQSKTITVSGLAKVHLHPKSENLSTDDIKAYTQPMKYWEADDQTIKRLGQQLKTPQAIYDYVVKTLGYDFSRVTTNATRLGALGALQNPKSAACREFTDLYIALARSAGIPSREIDGFAYTENPNQRPLSLVRDVLHAWPEYYDFQKHMWIMIDPTWGNTTGGVDYFSMLDLDHMEFVIKGLDSSFPLSAGGYKTTQDRNTKQVSVAFTDIFPQDHAVLGVTTTNPESVIAGLPFASEVSVTNKGNLLSQSTTFDVYSYEVSPSTQTLALAPIPPFGTVKTEAYLNLPFLTNRKMSFTIRFAGKEYTQNVTIKPFFLTPLGIGGIIFGIFIFTLSLIAVKSGRLRLSR